MCCLDVVQKLAHPWVFRVELGARVDSLGFIAFDEFPYGRMFSQTWQNTEPDCRYTSKCNYERDNAPGRIIV